MIFHSSFIINIFKNIEINKISKDLEKYLLFYESIRYNLSYDDEKLVSSIINSNDKKIYNNLLNKFRVYKNTDGLNKLAVFVKEEESSKNNFINYKKKIIVTNEDVTDSNTILGNFILSVEEIKLTNYNLIKKFFVNDTLSYYLYQKNKDENNKKLTLSSLGARANTINSKNINLIDFYQKLNDIIKFDSNPNNNNYTKNYLNYQQTNVNIYKNNKLIKNEEIFKIIKNKANIRNKKNIHYNPSVFKKIGRFLVPLWNSMTSKKQTEYATNKFKKFIKYFTYDQKKKVKELKRKIKKIISSQIRHLQNIKINLKSTNCNDICKNLSNLKIIPQFNKNLYNLLMEQYEYNKDKKVFKSQVYMKYNDKKYFNPVLFNKIINLKLFKNINNINYFENFIKKEPSEIIKERTLEY